MPDTNLLVKESSLTNVADVIRSKSGSNSSMAFSEGFISNINNLEIFNPEFYLGKLPDGSTKKDVIIHGDFTLRASAFFDCNTIRKLTFTGLVGNNNNVSSVFARTAIEEIEFQSPNYNSTTMVYGGYSGFDRSTLLHTVTVATQTLYVGYSMYSGCTSLVRVGKKGYYNDFSGGNIYLNAYCFSGTAIPRIRINKGTSNNTNLGGCDRSFLNCTSLTYFDLGPDLTMNTNYAKTFGGCTALSALIFRNPNQVVPMTNANFLQDSAIESETGYIYVPKALVNDYKAATNWSVFSDQIRAIEDYPTETTWIPVT